MAILRLVPLSGGAPFEIKGEAAVVGREPGGDVVISDGSVSRKHARFEKRAAGYTVIDQGSANGTFLDSQRVAEVVVKSGQEIRFGAVAFRVEIEDDDDLSATMVATPAPDATVMSPAGIPPTPPLGVPMAPARAPGPAAPPPPPKAGPPPLSRTAPPPPRASAPPSNPAPAPGRERMSAPRGAPVGQIKEPPVAGKKGKGPVFWILTGCCGCLLIVVMLIAAFSGAIFFGTRAPANVVQTQLVELRRGDLEAAYHRLSSDYQAQLPREEFERLVREHPGLRENKDATFWNRRVSNDSAKLSGSLTSESGQVEKAVFELVKEGGGWRVSAIRVGDAPGE